MIKFNNNILSNTLLLNILRQIKEWIIQDTRK